MHDLWLFFLKKRSFTYLLMFSLIVSGLFSLASIPKESTPEVVVPIGVVSTTLRGASAEDTEKLITNKIEDEVANIENIDKVTSTSLEGVSVVTAQFIASADIDKSIQDLKDAVDRAKAELPKEADEPNVSRVNFADQPIIIASISVDAPEGALAKLGDDIKDEIKKIKGVSKVTVSGTRANEIQVVVKKESLEKYGLRVDQVVAALSAGNASFPIGNITVADINYPIKFSGSIDEPSQVPEIQITTQNGVPVYLSDVAFIADGLEMPRAYSRVSIASEPSSQAITLYAYKKSGGDVTQIAKAVVDRIDELKKTKLVGANVVVSFDRGALVTKDLRELTRVGLETVGLVILTLFLTIGWRESVVAALSIPLSFVIAFIGLYASGNTINFLSLFSLILAIGILVDSGIVVTEAIHARIKPYGGAENAAVASIHEYSWPLIAGTMATVVFFAPLFFLSGIVGKFIASIPFTLIFVLIASLWVALGMVPLLALVLTKEHKNKFEDMQEEYFEKAKAWYKSFLGGILDSRRSQNVFISVMFLGFVAAVALPVVGLVKVSFFPSGDQDFVYIQIEKPQGTVLAVTDLATREVEEMLYGNPNIESFVTTVGGSSAFSNTGPSNGSKLANITVILKKDRTKTSTEVMEELRKQLAPITDADIHVEQASNGPPSGAPVEMKFVGDDLNDLGIAADKAEKLLRDIPGTLDVRTSLRDDGTQFEITIDRDKASQVGLSAAAVAQTLRTAVSGSIATTIKKNQKDIDIVVKMNLNPNFVNPEDTIKTTIDSIRQIPLATPSGTVLMGSLVNTSVSESRASISHEDRKRTVSATAQIRPDVTAVEITNIFKKRIAEAGIPDTVEVKYGGENEDVNKTFSEMGYALLAGMILAFAILVLEFNSLRFPLYLILIIPLSLIGVFLGLALSGQALSFSSMLGVIALAGVIINHAIILLDSMLRILRNPENKRSLKDSIVEASAVRLRPIVLTTITTVIGMIPLTTASPLWGPLAFAIMFGLTFAMVLTLVFVPVFFYRWPGEFKSMKK
jgi:multidrug efflux pump subunit AcrB